MKRITDWVVCLAFLAGLVFLYQHYELGRYINPPAITPSKAEPQVQQPVVMQTRSPGDTPRIPIVEAYQMVNCPKVASKPLAEPTGSGVYQWTDANGKVHFGDRHAEQQRTAAAAQVQDLSDKYTSAVEYLDLHIETDSASLPVFLRDKVVASVRQIFSVLTVAIPKEQLRQVRFNLRIIATRDAFQRYKNRHAPELQTNTGFYLASINEAVVWQNRNEHSMLEVIKHEGAHLIMASLFGPTPTWLNEGFAEYVERLDVSGQTKKIDPNPMWLSYLQRQNKPLLHDYFQYNGAQWYQQNLDTMYSTAWSLLYFMMDSEQGKQLFQAFTSRLSAHPCLAINAEALIDRHFPGGLSAFESQWQRWLRQRQVLAHYH